MSKKTEDFVHLHVHTDASQLDGLGKVKDYVGKAVELGHPALGITDHGTMRQFVQQHEECSKAEIKPVYGCEFYVSRDMHQRGLTEEQKERATAGRPKSEHKRAIKSYEEGIGVRDRWHLTVFARDQEGLRNLYRLTSKAWVEGFYYKPRIDIATLVEHNEGLMVATGCLASPIHEMWRGMKNRAALRYASRLYEAFGDRMWIEVQPHDINEQREANRLAVMMRERYGLKLLATQDAHYVEQDDAEAHDCLLCIGTRSVVTDKDRFRFDGDQFHFKSRREMRRAFKAHHAGIIEGSLLREALDSTVELAESCTAKVEVDYKKVLLPDPGYPKKYNGDAFGFLRDLCVEGWSWRSIPHRARIHAKRAGISREQAIEVYKQRLFLELRLLKKQRFSPYFIMVRDIYREARVRGIMVGPGRGSVGGSLIAYLMGITAVDPIEHGLLFERFMNPDRFDMPDIDMDFEDSRRGELIEYMRTKYGADKVCQIATVGKLRGKQCFWDTCRVLGVPYNVATAHAPSIIERKPYEPREYDCIEDSFKEHKVLRKLGKLYPKIPKVGPRLEGTAKALGIHAAGVIAAPEPLQEICPLEVRTHGDEKVVVSALDMQDVPKLGLVKLDFLGLKTLTVIRRCLDAIEERHGKRIDLEAADFDINDPETLQAFTDGDFVGVFQYDSPSAVRVCKGIKFTAFADIATLTALNRPGTSKSGMDDKFREKKNDPELAKQHEFHPVVSEITSDTLGCMVYQEHLIKIFQQVGGFTPGEADKMRKVIGKKLGEEEINKHRDRFVGGAAKIGMDEETANKLFSAMVFFAGYGFNKSHATEYGLIGYWCQWLKVHYPLEFFWALLVAEAQPEKIRSYIVAAKQRGIQVLHPHVNTSKREFVIDGEAIRGAISKIKGIGDGAARTIMENAPYEDFVDFVARIDRKKCNRGAVMKLAAAGAFGPMVNLKWLQENIEPTWKVVGKLGKTRSARDELKTLIARSLRKPDYDEEELGLLRADVNPMAFGTHPLDAWESFQKRAIRVNVQSMGSESYHELLDDRGHWVFVMVKKVKKHQIGDFGDVEKDDPNFGKPYANVNVEDVSGVERRIKFHWSVYDQCQAAIDAGTGKALLVHCVASHQFESVRAHIAVDVEKLRNKMKSEQSLSIWERVVIGDHPARVKEWKSTEIRKQRMQNRAFLRSEEGGRFAGVVTHVQRSLDKNGNQMARFGMLDAVGHFVNVVAFASVWEDDVREVVRPGAFIRAALEKQEDVKGRISYLLQAGRLVVYERTDLEV